MNTNNEIEDMKRQMALLHERIANSVDIDDKQMSQALHSGLRGMQRRDRIALFVCILATFFVCGIVLFEQFSVWLLVATAVLMSVNAYMSYALRLKRSTLCNDDASLVDTALNLHMYKKQNRQYLNIALPIAVVYCCWYGYEALSKLGMLNTTKGYYFIAFLAACGSVGGMIGYFTFYRPAMQDADRVLQQIEELKTE